MNLLYSIRLSTELSDDLVVSSWRILDVDSTSGPFLLLNGLPTQAQLRNFSSIHDTCRILAWHVALILSEAQ